MLARSGVRHIWVTASRRTVALRTAALGLLAILVAAPTGAQEAQTAAHAMIASNSAVASQAGIDIIKRGGNAVDAAVAVGFALAVAYPEAGNLGGGGYMLIHLADGRTAAIDYREQAPASASRNMYVSGADSSSKASVEGYLASGVPGSVAGLCEAQRRYGKLPLREVMAPAIRLARDGFVVDSMMYRSLSRDRVLIAKFAGAKLFLPGGSPPARGSMFKQPALARTLEAIARGGPRAFYRGNTARQIAAAMAAHGGNITTGDLARYTAAWRTPLSATYRGYTLLTMPPSSSGGITMVEALNILATYPRLAPFGSTEYLHTLASAFQRAFIDRNARLGDPAFVDIPVRKMTSVAYAEGMRRTITERHTATSALVSPMDSALREGTETTHYSVMDGAGNAVSTTTTLNSLFGSGVYIDSVGIFMNNEMDDFTARPGQPNQFGLVMGETNAIAPGKRMLSSMSPTIVLDSTKRAMLVVGARGGPRITTATAEVILNVLDSRMSLAAAMRAPRIHHQALPDTLLYEKGAISPAVADSLRGRGWGLQAVGGIAQVDAVMRTHSGFAGMDDPRNGARAVGY